MTTEKVAFITGASGGIGQSIAKKLSESGYEIALGFKKNREMAQSIARSLYDKGTRCELIQIDLASLDSIRQGFAHIKNIFGRLDVLVNNAGLNLRHDPLSATPEMFDVVFDVNVRGLYFSSIEAAKIMLGQTDNLENDESGKAIQGRIINISAVTGRTVPPPGMILYGASKSAVDALTRGLASEWGPKGILVNAVAPGITETDLIRHDHPETIEKLKKSSCLGRLGLPEDTARLVNFLVQDRWIVGQSINASGGRLI